MSSRMNRSSRFDSPNRGHHHNGHGGGGGGGGNGGPGGPDRGGMHQPLVPPVTGLMAQMPPRPMPMFGGPTYDLPIKDTNEAEKKFTGRCRLFVANLPNNVTDESLRTLFEAYGEVSEVFLGKNNNFAFIKMDTRKHAEDARDGLDNKNYEGRTLRVRLAAHAAAVRVKNLTQMVTNELLEYAFSYFGEVERAIVTTDERGRPLGEAIVEFARKSSAQMCLKRCQQECFLLTSNPAPVIVEPFEQRDEEEGFSERHINRAMPEFRIEREVGPRFAEPGSFEFEFGVRFKELYDIERSKRGRLEIEIQESRQALIAQMDFQRMEHQSKILRDKLKEIESRAAKFETTRSQLLEQEKLREEERSKYEQMMRQREDEILRRNQLGVVGSGGDFRSADEIRMANAQMQDLIDREGAGGHLPVDHPDLYARNPYPPPPPPPLPMDGSGDPYNDPYGGYGPNGDSPTNGGGGVRYNDHYNGAGGASGGGVGSRPRGNQAATGQGSNQRAGNQTSSGPFNNSGTGNRPGPYGLNKNRVRRY